MVTAGELMAARAGSVTPANFPDEEFDLYSIPAHDQGSAEITVGRAIGSAKQVVRPGDVLLSKIVPHIRRAWVVGPNRGHRMIASGEWIVFRDERVDPRYLRHVLLGDPFHVQFMSTVAGVGGSLLRARPTFVAKIQIPLPLLDEQRRIAATLDQADDLRTKRRETLAHLDELTQSIFLDMFGDPSSNPMGWPMRPLGELSSIAGEYGAAVAAVDFDPERPRYVRITDVTESGELKSEVKSPGGNVRDWSKFLLAEGDLLFARSGATVGKTYLHRGEDGPCVFAGYLIRFRPDPASLSPVFAFHFTKTQSYKSWVTARQRVVAQPNINAREYGQELLVPVPPLDRQHEFADRAAAVDQFRTLGRNQLARLDSLFASLQSRAFFGAL